MALLVTAVDILLDGMPIAKNRLGKYTQICVAARPSMNRLYHLKRRIVVYRGVCTYAVPKLLEKIATMDLTPPPDIDIQAWFDARRMEY